MTHATRKTLPIFAALIVLSLSLIVVPTAYAQDGTLAYPGQVFPTTVDNGQLFDVEFTIECSGLTTGCDNVDITVSVPDGAVLDIENVVIGGSKLQVVSETVIGPDRVLRIQSSNYPACAGSACVDGGDAFDVEFQVRLRSDAWNGPGTTVPIVISGTTDVGNTGFNQTIPIDPPTFDWRTNKNRTVPASAPAPGSVVEYQVALQRTSLTGNFDITTVDVVDTIPPGAVVVNAGGGTVAGNTITWSGLGPFTYTGGETVWSTNVVLQYPSPPFSVGDTVTNQADFTATYDDGTGPAVGNCVAQCINATDTLAPPSLNPSHNKVIIQNPVGIDGTSRFNIDFGVGTSNTNIDDLVLIDEVSEVTAGAPNDDLTIQITGVRGATWTNETWFPGAVFADVYTSNALTCGASDTFPVDLGVWTLLTTFDGTGRPTSNVAATDIRCVRFQFRYDNGGTNVNGVPLGFDLNQPFQILFTPRNSAVALGTTYNNANCLDTTYAGGSIAQNCANLTVAPTANSINIDTNKTSSDNTPNPGDTVTFDLDFIYTERSSGVGADLDELTLVDAIPPEYTFVQATVFRNQSMTGLPTVGSVVVPTSNTVRSVTVGGTTENRRVLVWKFGDETTAPLNIPPPVTGDKRFTLRVEATLGDYSPPQNAGNADSYTNAAFFFVGDGANLICEQGQGSIPTVTDTQDIDNNGSATDEGCFESALSQVPAVKALSGQKWIRNETLVQTAIPGPTTDAPPLTSADCELANTYLTGAANIVAETDYSRTPCITEGLPGHTFSYRLTIQNDGNEAFTPYQLVDILPYVGDTGISPAQVGNGRLTEWRPYLQPNGVTFVQSWNIVNNPLVPTAITAPNGLNDNGDFTIEYSTSSNPCRPEVGVGGGCDAPNWTAGGAVADWTLIRSFRIVSNGGLRFEPGDHLEFLVTMTIPDDSNVNPAVDPPIAGGIAWNNFAHNGTGEVTGAFGGIDVLKVGIRIPETVSVGNRVWYDYNNNRQYDPADPIEAEVVVPGVTLGLYQWTGAGVGPLVATTTTDAQGYYIFNLEAPGQNLDGDTVNTPSYIYGQEYVVRVEASNFALGQPLFDFISSTGTEDTDYSGADTRDRGLDPADPTVSGVVSSPFVFGTLTNPDGVVGTSDDRVVTGLPTGEVDPNPASSDDPLQPGDDVNDPFDDFGKGTEGTNDFGAFGRGDLGQDDDNSNLIVDFGFYQPMSIGNRVWIDDGRIAAGGSNPANFDNSLFDADELGVSGVTLNLYRDANSNGVIDPAEATPVDTDVTDANGYYLFETFAIGDYIVEIPATQFQPTGPLVGFVSSTDAGALTDDNTDENDDGIDNADLPTNGIFSPVIELRRNDEIETETDFSGDAGDGPGSIGTLGQDDNDSNLTVDFGFFQPRLSIGNIVWLDMGAGTPANFNNATIDAGENGIPGVTVQLYRDTNTDGVLNAGDTLIGTTTTDDAAADADDGYYLFDDLVGGTYFVALPNSNFTGVGPLVGLTSSTSVPAPVDGNGDSTDHGIDTLDPTFGLISPPIVLAPGLEPTGETDLSADAADGPAGERRGNQNQDDNDSDLTVDFGLYQPMSIGNRVWRDNGSTAGGPVPAQRLDSIQNGDEPGIDGVTVQLFRDDGDNTFNGADTLVDTFVTTGGGYYLFDGLPPGPYFVHLPPANFNGAGVLVGLTGSPGNITDTAPDNDLDQRDNGIDNPDLATNGVVSPLITLDGLPSGQPAGLETTAETDLSADTATFGPNSRGTNGEADNNSDLTIDFGFDDPRLSIGNIVWLDEGNGTPANANNAQIDAGENGIPNVTVQLYADTDGSSTLNAGDALVGTTTTDDAATDAEDGYYLFDNLLPGTYFVTIPNSNFTGAGPLVGLASSTDVAPNPEDDTPDSNDHGFDFPDPTYGIISPPIVLTLDNEPTGETDLSADPADGPTGERRGNQGQDDNDSDLTVDFGFRTPMSIGNRVWRDNGATAGGPVTAQRLNGIQDGTEPGIPGVVVNLYADNGDGTFVLADETLVGTTTTNATGTPATEGYYLFDNLVPGQYFVRIEPGNFIGGNPLDGLSNSPGNITDGAADNDLDQRDNGIDPTDPTVDGVVSPLITLDAAASGAPAGLETTADTDLSTDTTTFGPNSRGRFGEADNNSDLTIDFGFDNPRLSIGNIVWLDGGGGVLANANNGVIDANEFGIPGVTVELFADTNTNGVLDAGDASVGTTTTDSTGTPASEGYYLFDDLLPGTYFVTIPNSNFTGVGAACRIGEQH